MMNIPAANHYIVKHIPFRNTQKTSMVFPKFINDAAKDERALVFCIVFSRPCQEKKPLFHRKEALETCLLMITRTRFINPVKSQGSLFTPF